MCRRPRRRSLPSVGTELSDDTREEWAVSLHGGTLQGLVAVRMLLNSGLGASQPDALRAAVEQSVHQLEYEIGELRALIAEMRSRPGHAVPET